jgi:predicted TIM-barrel enzyme
MTATNLRLLDGVRGAIVGSYFKTDGNVNFGSRVEEGRVEKFMEALTRRFTL